MGYWIFTHISPILKIHITTLDSKFPENEWNKLTMNKNETNVQVAHRIDKLAAKTYT